MLHLRLLPLYNEDSTWKLLTVQKFLKIAFSTLLYLKDIISDEFSICGALIQMEILFVYFDLMEKYEGWLSAVTFSFTYFSTCLYMWHPADSLPLG